MILKFRNLMKDTKTCRHQVHIISFISEEIYENRRTNTNTLTDIGGYTATDSTVIS
jgi:hypothetical protein